MSRSLAGQLVAVLAVGQLIGMGSGEPHGAGDLGLWSSVPLGSHEDRLPALRLGCVVEGQVGGHLRQGHVPETSGGLKTDDVRWKRGR